MSSHLVLLAVGLIIFSFSNNSGTCQETRVTTSPSYVQKPFEGAAVKANAVVGHSEKVARRVKKSITFYKSSVELESAEAPLMVLAQYIRTTGEFIIAGIGLLLIICSLTPYCPVTTSNLVEVVRLNVSPEMLLEAAALLQTAAARFGKPSRRNIVRL